MKQIAIIGGGVSGLSLAYTLSQSSASGVSITLFDAPDFFPTCSLNSTAIVAPRGVTSGHSALGDLLVSGFATFKEHILRDHPTGVEPVLQKTATTEKIEQFKVRYPAGVMEGETYVATEEAFAIHPESYLAWLKKNSQATFIHEMVSEVNPASEGFRVKTSAGLERDFTHVIFCCGIYQSFWKNLFPDSKLHRTRPVQGSYYRFQEVDLGETSFSRTLDGDNAIYSKPQRTLLIGSTTQETATYLAPTGELETIYQRLASKLSLPPSESGEVKVGIREKAPKREPYLLKEGNALAVGGFYKNGYILSLHLAREAVKLLT